MAKIFPISPQLDVHNSAGISTEFWHPYLPEIGAVIELRVNQPLAKSYRTYLHFLSSSSSYDSNIVSLFGGLVSKRK